MPLSVLAVGGQRSDIAPAVGVGIPWLDPQTHTLLEALIINNVR
jgi:hypothetical protein